MAFQDAPMTACLVGKTVSGLGLSQIAAMTLEVATGSVVTHSDGVTHTLTPAVSQIFTADATYPTVVSIGLIDNGVSVDVWIDDYVDDGFNVQASIPSGYEYIADIAWFQIAANETDLSNGTINRRTWV